MPDYIPSRDADAMIWMGNLSAYVTGNGLSFGLTAPQITDITTKISAFASAIGEVLLAESQLDAIVQVKKDARAEAEAACRFARNVMYPHMNDAARAAAGFTVTGGSGGGLGINPPPTHPLLQVDTSQPLRHTLNFVDEGTPTKKAKPPGVSHVELWMKIGDPVPTGPETMDFIGNDSKTPFIVTFDAQHAGKKAHYLLRWVSTAAKTGPWSPMTSATITAV